MKRVMKFACALVVMVAAFSLTATAQKKVQDSKTIISMRLQGLYRSSTARWADDFTNHATILQLKPTAIAYGYTVHKTEFTNATGGLIRPVLAE